MRHKIVLVCLAAGLGLAWLASGLGNAAIAVDRMWMHPTVAQSPGSEAYASIINDGAQSDALVGVQTPIAEVAELYDTGIEDGVVRLRKIDTLPLPFGDTVHLEPGGLHIQLKGLRRELVSGDRFPITFTFQRQSAITVEAVVGVKPPASSRRRGSF